jgi:TonB family protein
LAREQTVDAQVIRITASRKHYIDALLAVAGGHLQPDLAPAPLFLRKTHLAQRIAIILKEVSMSKKRLLSSLAAVCGALVITARFATLYFPISAPAQEVVKGGDNLLHRGPIEYPADAIEKRVDGTVVVEATLNDRGVVTDARVISGPDLLRKAALKSVLDWHYNAQTQSPVEVAVDFKLPEKKPGTIIGSVPTAIPNGRLMRIQAVGISPALRDAVIGHLAIQVGDLIAPDTLDRARRAVREVDEHLDVRYSAVITNTGEKEYSLVIFATAPIVGQVTSEGPQRIRVGGNVQATMAISAPKPLYPPDAKQARIQGTVRMNVVIGKDGTVKDLQVASGHPLLVDTAADAVRQWVYKPTLLNGNPVEVVTVVDVNFTLSQ